MYYIYDQPQNSILDLKKALPHESVRELSAQEAEAEIRSQVERFGFLHCLTPSEYIEGVWTVWLGELVQLDISFQDAYLLKMGGEMIEVQEVMQLNLDIEFEPVRASYADIRNRFKELGAGLPDLINLVEALESCFKGTVIVE